jgi:hypothetical protein
MRYWMPPPAANHDPAVMRLVPPHFQRALPSLANSSTPRLADVAGGFRTDRRRRPRFRKRWPHSVAKLPPLTPAWRDSRLQFDRGYEPVVLGKRLFLASSREDKVAA